MKEIYIIRHGETNYNINKISQTTDYLEPINKTGRLQAIKTGKYLRDYRINDKSFDCIYSSPYKRTTQTAKIIGRITKCKNIQYIEELHEIEKGLLHASKEKQINNPLYNEFNDALKELDAIEDPIEKVLYEKNELRKIMAEKYKAEKMSNVDKRIKKFIKIIIESPYEKIIVITHQGTIAEFIRILLHIDSFYVPIGDVTSSRNCTITYIVFKNNRFYLITPPNTSHLKIYD